MAAYNQTEQYDSAEAFADSFWDSCFPNADDGGGGDGGGGGGRGGGAAATATAAAAAATAGARGSEEGGQRGLEMYPDQFRPMFLVLLDAMHNVQFSECADEERE